MSKPRVIKSVFGWTVFYERVPGWPCFSSYATWNDAIRVALSERRSQFRDFTNQYRRLVNE